MKLNIPRLPNYIKDTVDIPGLVVQVGLAHHHIFKQLINGCPPTKSIIGVENNLTDVQLSIMEREFNQLKFDNWKILANYGPDSIDKEIDLISLVIIDSNLKNLSEILDLCWTKMAFGSTICITSFTPTGNTGNNKIIKEFMNAHKSEITEARQMIVNGHKEVNLTIKCFPLSRRPIINESHDTLTIATVLKSGGEYTVEYVNNIARSISKNVTVPYTFVCLTDLSEGFSPLVHKIIPFDHNFERWWGKIELFSPGKFNTNKIFYIDLDTLILDNIDEILLFDEDFCSLRDFYSQFGLASGIMMWKNYNPKMYQIYEKFMENPTYHMANNRYGDQAFIGSIIHNILFFQDLYKNKIVSYKKDCLLKNGQLSIPPEAKIICFHGPPRPHTIKHPEIIKYWRG